MIIILYWWIGCVVILCRNVNSAPYTVFNHYSTTSGSKSSSPQVFVSYAHYPEESGSNTGDPYLDNYYNSKNARKYFRKILKNSFDGPALSDNGQEGIMNSFQYYAGNRPRRPESSNRIRYENLLRQQLNGHSNFDQYARSEETRSLLSLSKDMDIPECVHEKMTMKPCVYMETGGESEVAQYHLKPGKNIELSEAVKLADHYPYSQLVQEGKDNKDKEFFLNSQPSIIVNNKKFDHKNEDCVKNVMKGLNTEVLLSTPKETREQENINKYEDAAEQEQSVFSGYNLKEVTELLKILKEQKQLTDKDEPTTKKLNLSAEKISNIFLAITEKQREDNLKALSQAEKFQPVIVDKEKLQDPRLSNVFIQFTPSLDTEKDKERERNIEEVRKNSIKGKTQELIQPDSAKDNNNAKEEFSEEVGISFNDWSQVNEVLRKLEEAKKEWVQELQPGKSIKPETTLELGKSQKSKLDNSTVKISHINNKNVEAGNKIATKPIIKDTSIPLKETEFKKVQPSETKKNDKNPKIVNDEIEYTGVDPVLENLEDDLDNIDRRKSVESEESKKDIILIAPVDQKPYSVLQPQPETSNGKSNIESKLVGPLFKQKQQTLNSYFAKNANPDRDFLNQPPLNPIEKLDTNVLANIKEIEKSLIQPVLAEKPKQEIIFENPSIQPSISVSESTRDNQEVRENLLIQPLLKQKEKTMTQLFDQDKNKQPDIIHPQLHEREGDSNNDNIENRLIQPFYRQREQALEQILPNRKNDDRTTIQQYLIEKKKEDFKTGSDIINGPEEPEFSKKQNTLGGVVLSTNTENIVIEQSLNENFNKEQKVGILDSHKDEVSLIQPLFKQKQKLLGDIVSGNKNDPDVAINQNVQNIVEPINNVDIESSQPIKSLFNQNMLGKASQTDQEDVIQQDIKNVNIEESLIQPLFKQNQNMVEEIIENSKISQDIVSQHTFNQNHREPEVGRTIMNNQNIQEQHILQPFMQSANEIQEVVSENKKNIANQQSSEPKENIENNAQNQNSLMQPFFKQKQRNLNKFFVNNVGTQTVLLGNENLNTEVVNRGDIDRQNILNKEMDTNLENQGAGMNLELSEVESYLKQLEKNGKNLDELKQLLEPKINKDLTEKSKDSKSVSEGLEKGIPDGQEVLINIAKTDGKVDRDDKKGSLKKNMEIDLDSYEDTFEKERLLDPDEPNFDQDEDLYHQPPKIFLVKGIPNGNVIKEKNQIRDQEREIKFNGKSKEDFNYIQAIEDTSLLKNTGGEDLPLVVSEEVKLIPPHISTEEIISKDEETIEQEDKSKIDGVEAYDIEPILPKTRADLDEIGVVFPEIGDSIEPIPSMEDNSEPIEIQPVVVDHKPIIKYEAFVVEAKLSEDENSDKGTNSDAADIDKRILIEKTDGDNNDINFDSIKDIQSDTVTDSENNGENIELIPSAEDILEPIDKTILEENTDENISNIYLNSDEYILPKTKIEDSIEFTPSVENSEELNSDDIFIYEPEPNIKKLDTTIDLDTDDSIYDISSENERIIESLEDDSKEDPIFPENIIGELTASEESVENNKNTEYMENNRKLIELYNVEKTISENESIETEHGDKSIVAKNLNEENINIGQLKEKYTASEESVERHKNPKYMDDIKRTIEMYHKGKEDLENEDIKELNEPVVSEYPLEYTSPLNEEFFNIENENNYNPETNDDAFIELENENTPIYEKNNENVKLTASEESVENNKNPEYMENIHKVIKFYSLQKANLENENNKELNEPLLSERNVAAISPLNAELNDDTQFSEATENLGEIHGVPLIDDAQILSETESIRNRREISFAETPNIYNIDPQFLYPRYRKPEKSSANRNRRETSGYFKPGSQLFFPFKNDLPYHSFMQQAGLSRNLRHILNDHQATIAETRVLNYDPIIEYVNAHLQNYIERNNIIKGRFENELDNRKYLTTTNFCKDCDGDILESIKHILENPPEFLEHFEER